GRPRRGAGARGALPRVLSRTGRPSRRASDRRRQRLSLSERAQGMPMSIANCRRQIAKGKSAKGKWSVAGVLLGVLALQGAAQSPAYTYRKVMVPVRDDVRLETVIAAPANAAGPLPILLRRSPYGVPPNADFASGPTLKDLASDGYIFVVQNLR